MSDGVLTFPTKAQPDRTVQWADEVRALALELWYTDAGRSLKTLEAIIAGDPYNAPVPYQTLWYWHRVDHWDIEADKRADAYAPNRRSRTRAHLDVAAEKGASYLAQVNSGAVEPDKARILAAKVSLDAAGYAATRLPDAPAERQPLPELPPVTTAEEAMDRIAFLRERSRQR
jgi:hypothetical protein